MKRFASLTLVILCLFVVNRVGFVLAQESMLTVAVGRGNYKGGKQP